MQEKMFAKHVMNQCFKGLKPHACVADVWISSWQNVNEKLLGKPVPVSHIAQACVMLGMQEKGPEFFFKCCEYNRGVVSHPFHALPVLSSLPWHTRGKARGNSCPLQGTAGGKSAHVESRHLGSLPSV